MFRTLAPQDIFKPFVFFAVQGAPVFLQKKIFEYHFTTLFQASLNDGDFDFLSDKTVAISVTDLKYLLVVTLKNNEFVILANNVHTDLTITGDLEAFLSLATRKEDPDTLFFQRKLSIEGNVELGLELKNVMDGIEVTTLSPKLKKSLLIAHTLSQRLKKPIFSYL